MTPECLPTEIESVLHQIIAINEFRTNYQLNYTQIVTNTISSSCKITIKDSEKQLNLFIKFLNKKCPSEFVLYFNNELIFYGELLKLFNCRTFAPKCHQFNTLFIVMEDVLMSGYKSFNINERIHVEDVRLIVQQLGRFHGCSFVAKTLQSNLFAHATSKIKETVFRRDNDGSFRKLFTHSIHDVFKLAKQSFPKESLYVEKLAMFTLNCFDRMADLADDDDEYKVISHGDLWPSNIFHKSQDIIFIDYHACRYSSPVHDLMLVLFLTLDRKNRDEHRHELIQHYYHRSLCETILQFNLDPLRLFPYSALQNQLVKHTKLPMALALAGLPLYVNETVSKLSDNSIISAPNSASTNFDRLFEFVRDLQARKSMQCKNKMLDIVMDCVDSGYL